MHFCVEKEPIVRSNEQPFSETLPFENYRPTTTTTNPSISRPSINDNSSNNIYLRHQQRNNHSYAGANRLSDDEYEEREEEEEGNGVHNGEEEEEEDHEREADDEDDDEQQRQLKRKNNGQIPVQSSMPSNMMSDNFSRNIPTSSFIDSSVRSSPNASTIMMMMKGNGNTGLGGGGGIPHQSQPVRNEKSAYEHRTVVVSSSVRPTSSGSSSSSSSLPVDEQQQQQQQHHHIRPRGYNFVPAPFNGSRLIAKSTEQLNRSFANDSLVKYCTPPTTPTTSLFQNPPKTNSPTSILKQNYLQKYNQNSSKINAWDSSVVVCMLFTNETNISISSSSSIYFPSFFVNLKYDQ